MLIYKLDLDIVKIYLHTKNELSESRLSKVRARTGETDTDRRDERNTTPHSRVVKDTQSNA